MAILTFKEPKPINKKEKILRNIKHNSNIPLFISLGVNVLLAASILVILIRS